MNLVKAIATDVPGDGSCLFHAIAFPITSPDFSVNGQNLRDLTSSIIERHPNELLHGVTLSNWIVWDNPNTSVQEYARGLKKGMWGGALEMTILASLLNVNMFVYVMDPESSHRGRGKKCSRVTEVFADPTFLKLAVKRPNITVNGSRGRQGEICLLWVNKCHYMNLDILFR